MTDLNAKERALRALQTQVDKLGEVRNAGTRDPGFKLWRQSTLTLIQRTWEGDDTRSTRFLRVPFSPPSTRADERSLRDWYERGCGEALQILKSLIAEIESEGLPVNTRASRVDRRGPSESEEVFPTVTLPGPGRKSAEAARASEIPRLPSSLPAASAAPAVPAVPVAPAAQAVPATAAAPARTRANGAKNGPRGLRNGRRGNSKPRLKDLLGFGDDASAPGARPDPPSTEPVGPVSAPATHSSVDDANDRALQAALEAALEPIFEEDAGRAAADFLQNSPVFRARPMAVEPRRASASGALRSPSAIAVATIAAEVATLGVTEGSRAQVRAALLDLAQQLDTHEFTWVALREAVNFVMQFPGVGRRVLPLLIPYLDEAA